MLLFDTDSIDTVCATFEQFEHVSGLKVKFDKTEIYLIGSLKGTQIPLYTKNNIKWSPDSIKSLGIHITYDKIALNKLNYIIKVWSLRNFTIYGKVAVIKAHLQSQVVYQMSVLPSPCSNFLKSTQRLIFQYVWSKKPDKICRRVLYGPREYGGVSVPNIECQNESLKVAWIHHLLSDSQAGWS
jgi:hypothetical protein